MHGCPLKYWLTKFHFTDKLTPPCYPEILTDIKLCIQYLGILLVSSVDSLYPLPFPLLCLSRQSFHEIDTGGDDKNNGGGVVWGISRYYFHFYMIQNVLTVGETAFNSTDKDHRNTIPD